MARSFLDPSIRALDDALDALMTLRAALDPIEPLETRVPAEALEHALKHHVGYRRAKADTAEAVRRLQAQLDAEGRADLLSLESLLREEGGIVADVAYGLAVRERTSRSR